MNGTSFGCSSGDTILNFSELLIVGKVEFSENRLMALPCPICLKIPVFSEEIVLSPVRKLEKRCPKKFDLLCATISRYGVSSPLKVV